MRAAAEAAADLDRVAEAAGGGRELRGEALPLLASEEVDEEDVIPPPEVDRDGLSLCRSRLRNEGFLLLEKEIPQRRQRFGRGSLDTGRTRLTGVPSCFSGMAAGSGAALLLLLLDFLPQVMEGLGDDVPLIEGSRRGAGEPEMEGAVEIDAVDGSDAGMLGVWREADEGLLLKRGAILLLAGSGCDVGTPWLKQGRG